MKRVILSGLIAGALFVFAHRPAQAMAEFCPASLTYERVGSGTALIRQQSSKGDVGKSTSETSSLYGFELSAFGARTITSATLTFDTSGGWYTAHVPAVVLSEKDRHYTGPSSSFTRMDYTSPVLYVHFPQAVRVRNGWVSEAAAQGDLQFDWDKRGAVACDPAPQGVPLIAVASINTRARDWVEDNLYKLDPKDADRLSSAPQNVSQIVTAAPLDLPIADASCTRPFDFAMVTRQGHPDYPDDARGRGYFGVSTAEVAIDERGNFVDAWIWGPSGHSSFDEQALRAARESSYSAGKAYCKPAAGYYFFRVTFDPSD